MDRFSIEPNGACESLVNRRESGSGSTKRVQQPPPPSLAPSLLLPDTRLPIVSPREPSQPQQQWREASI